MTALRGGAEIRRAFLDFFRERDHTVVPSASLIPVDPTLLLTNAGMVPFKPYFLGEQRPPYRRAASVQKCLRTIDIDIVGTTSRHATFFEMLGNFSFGDYFKEKAIPWAYEFVTEHLGLDPEVLWFTIFEDDEEAAAIWIDGVGVRPDRLQRGSAAQGTFWQMGVPGPCGPSSEIFVDRGPAFGPGGGPIEGGEAAEHRFIEVWNLVFMQNLQDEPYHVVGDLPSRNIDTGMGLERAAMVMQGVDSIFETDLVRPVLSAAERLTGTAYGAAGGSDVALRLLADHGRGLTFLIADGVVPSNEGRGYVLRRLVRRAVRHAWALGATDLVTPGLVEATVEVLGGAYPALVEGRDGILETAEREEVRFRRTLEGGYTLLEKEFDGLEAGAVVPGSVAFRLHDTYGFPVELTAEIAAERGFGLDRTGFTAEMEAQRRRARAAWKGGPDEAGAPVYREILDRSGPTEFVGYERLDEVGRILSIVREGEAVEEAEAGQLVELYLDRTPFYAESGGQVGDTGSLATASGRARVDDTQLPVHGLHGHHAEVIEGTLRVGQEARLSVDRDRRERIRKSHTGTHVLHWALRRILGQHVQQAGSLVEPGRFRFDFSHYAGVGAEEMAAVEEAANERVIENARVAVFEVSRDEAAEMGALAFFGEKYGERVRVVEAGDFSRELCGGTHVPATGQIGPVVVVNESSIGSNVRRVEAYTGSHAFRYLSDLRAELLGVAGHLRVRPDAAAAAAGSLLARNRELEKRLAGYEDQARSGAAAALAEAAEEVGGARLVVASRVGLLPDELRALAIQVRDRLGRGLVVLGAERDGKAGLVAAATRDLVQSGLSAAQVLAGAARLLGGGSSRDPELAQAGGPHGDRLGEALEVARADARARLGES
ncbi:MAG TPA: alanine--tRNA ligase [Acidimicrobiia bacterium]|nr:alanine--tRNA ligase [Acidimicrobiia bacterium]